MLRWAGMGALVVVCACGPGVDPGFAGATSDSDAASGGSSEGELPITSISTAPSTTVDPGTASDSGSSSSGDPPAPTTTAPTTTTTTDSGSTTVPDSTSDDPTMRPTTNESADTSSSSSSGIFVGCGDGAIDPGEQCDGDDLQGFDCASLGLGGGELACDPVTCTFDTSMCGPVGSTSG